MKKEKETQISDGERTNEETNDGKSSLRKDTDE